MSEQAKRVKFRIRVDDLVITGEADGTRLLESWNYVPPKKADRAAFTGPQEVGRTKITLLAFGDVRAHVVRSGEAPRRLGKRGKR
jgi:hypothetical protein